MRPSSQARKQTLQVLQTVLSTRQSEKIRIRWPQNSKTVEWQEFSKDAENPFSVLQSCWKEALDYDNHVSIAADRKETYGALHQEPEGDTNPQQESWES